MLAVFGLRSVVPAGYMLGASERSDGLVIELCSGSDTKFVRLNLNTGETEAIDPNAPAHGDDDSQSLESERCISSLSTVFDLPDPVSWRAMGASKPLENVAAYRRNSVRLHTSLPPLPARGPPLGFDFLVI